MSIDHLQTNCEKSKLIREVPIIDLSVDSDSEAETIVPIVPRIQVLEGRILPATEHVRGEMRQQKFIRKIHTK